MDPRHLARLREEQQKAVTETDNRIEQCQKFKTDYKALTDRLKTLPDVVKHEIMVPFGRLGFMPGQLTHTNEVMVLLGDNWFVERSAKQASAIAHRRMKELDKQIQDLEKQKELLTPRLDFTSELQSELQGSQDMQEIVEEYDEEKERLWNEQHKKNVKKYRAQLRQEQEQASPKAELGQRSTSDPSHSDPDLWARLDHLEKLEEERGDLDSSENESDDETPESPVPSEEKIKANRRVSWADAETTRLVSPPGDDESDGDDDEESASDDGDESPQQPTKVINFKHTSNTPDSLALRSAQDDSPAITSPADIYKLFCPKSILKKRSSGDDKASVHTTLHPASLTSDTRTTHMASSGDAEGFSGKQAFSGQIVERSELARTEAPKPAQPTKRVSRFKAQRMQNSS